MKLKTTAIAMAVAGTIAAPVVVQAGADEIYASARIGVWNTDTGGESEADVRSFSSRFGAKGETDLGNGLTGFGRYEWDVDFKDHGEDATDRGGSNVVSPGSVDDGDKDDIDVRLRYVGLKGDFGQVLIGQTTHTLYNFTSVAIDNPWWHAGYNLLYYGSPTSSSSSRADNGITYSGSTGAIAFGFTAYIDADAEDAADDAVDAAVDAVNLHSTAVAANVLVPGTFSAAEIASLAADASSAISDADSASRGEDGVDAWEVGGSFGFGEMSLGFAVAHSEIIDDDVTSISLDGVELGDLDLGFLFQANDDDTGLAVNAQFGGAYVHIETTSFDDADVDPVAITLGYTQSIGRKTTAYYEVWSFDKDTDDSDDDIDRVMAVLKYDII